MNDMIPLRKRRLTAEEILASLTDAYALNANFNDMAPYCTNDVHANMTIKDYCDDMEIDDFCGYLNHWFGLALTRDEVRSVAAPARRRTLGEMCEFLANRVEAPAIDPVTVLGLPCLSAGAFLTVRTMLARAGADVSRLAPSSPLGPYLRSHFMVFARDVSKLSPGSFPRIEDAERRTISFLCLGFGITAIVGFVALVIFVDRQFLSWCSPLMATAFLAVVFISWLRGRGSRQNPELAGVHDFRDLVDKLLNRPSRHAATPETLS